MIVKCIDASNRNAGGEKCPLVYGEIYEAREWGSRYKIDGYSWAFFPDRFIILPEDACPQCGDIH